MHCQWLAGGSHPDETGGRSQPGGLGLSRTFVVLRNTILVVFEAAPLGSRFFLDALEPWGGGSSVLFGLSGLMTTDTHPGCSDSRVVPWNHQPTGTL